eukprot:2774787-Amphidinium_carterae.1
MSSTRTVSPLALTGDSNALLVSSLLKAQSTQRGQRNLIPTVTRTSTTVMLSIRWKKMLTKPAAAVTIQDAANSRTRHLPEKDKWMEL